MFVWTEIWSWELIRMYSSSDLVPDFCWCQHKHFKCIFFVGELVVLKLKYFGVVFVVTNFFACLATSFYWDKILPIKSIVGQMCPLHVNQSIEKSQKFHLPFDFEIFLLRTIEELFFFYLGFLQRTITNHRTAGEERGGGHLFNIKHLDRYRHLDISREITAESSTLHIASSRARTRNLWFPSASR